MNKIKNIAAIGLLFVRNLFRFGAGIAWYQLLDRVSSPVVIPMSFWLKICRKKHHHIKQYLSRKYEKIFNFYNSEYIPHVPETKPRIIWQSWWQGADRMDDLVKCCTLSVKKNSNRHKIVLVTGENFEKYVDLPPHIIAKLGKGNITLTQFSDILRMSLLNQHGGLWVDATIFLSSPLDERIFRMPLFSCKDEKEGIFVSNYRWTGFCIGGEKGHILFDYMCRIFYAYWKDHDSLIDYFLIDYLIALGYERIPAIRQAIDAIDRNNASLYELVANINRPYSPELYARMCAETQIHKLSRKMILHDKTSSGEETFWSHLKKTYCL